jgi:hypothetical protein
MWTDGNDPLWDFRDLDEELCRLGKQVGRVSASDGRAKVKVTDLHEGYTGSETFKITNKIIVAIKQRFNDNILIFD